MKRFIPMIVLALSACATVPSQHKPADVNASPSSPGTTTITGEDLRRTGRTEPGEALRASSPLFH